MARNLSWIDPEQLADLLDVVSPAPAEVDGTEGQEGDSALFVTATAPGATAPGATTAGATTKTARPAPQQPANQVGASARAPGRTATPPTPPPTPRSTPQPALQPSGTGPGNQGAASARGTATAVTPSQPAATTFRGQPFQPGSDTGLGDRMAAFIDWILPTTQSHGAIVTDAHGLVVVERGADQVEAAMSASVNLMLNHVSGVIHGDADPKTNSDLSGYVVLQREGVHLTTLWAPTEYGRFFGVLISATAPSPESLALVGQGLQTLFAN